MHRLFTVTAVIVSGLLIARSADARPHYTTHDGHIGTSAASDKALPKLLESASKGKPPSASEPRKDITVNMRAKARRLRTARNVEAQWRPGLISKNVRIVRISTARSSSAFHVEREMKESGEKGGTQDINIGVGELQECTISKSMDSASPYLAQLAKSRRRLPQLILKGTDARGQTFVIRMKHVFISSYQTGGSSAKAPRTETATIVFTGLE